MGYQKKLNIWKELLQEQKGDVFGEEHKIVEGQLKVANPEIALIEKHRLQLFQNIFRGKAEKE